MVSGHERQPLFADLFQSCCLGHRFVATARHSTTATTTPSGAAGYPSQKEVFMSAVTLMILGGIEEEEDAVASVLAEHVDAVVRSVEVPAGSGAPGSGAVEEILGDAGRRWTACDAQLCFERIASPSTRQRAWRGSTIATYARPLPAACPAQPLPTLIYLIIDDRNQTLFEPRYHPDRAAGPRGQDRGLEAGTWSMGKPDHYAAPTARLTWLWAAHLHPTLARSTWCSGTRTPRS